MTLNERQELQSKMPYVTNILEGSSANYNYTDTITLSTGKVISFVLENNKLIVIEESNLLCG